MSAAPLSFVPVLMAIALHTTGCATPLAPEAQCFADATTEYRAAWRAAEAIRTDLDRGYALHPVPVRQAEVVTCHVDGARSNCLQEVNRTEHLPVAIDRGALERRLATLEARMDRLRPPAMERAAACGFAERLAAGEPVRSRP